MKNVYSEKNDKECDEEVTNCRNMIIKTIYEIENKKALRFIYDLINSFKEKWGI